MKAYLIIWNKSEGFHNDILPIGTFHLECAFLMLGKKMVESRFSDILLETGLIGSGFLHGVVMGKHYERALHYHKVWTEAVE